MKIVKPNRSSMPKSLARQRGASLLEGIAYLGIAAIVVLGAVSLLTNAFGSAKGNQTTEEIIALRTAVRKLYTGQPYPDEALLPHLILANAIPNTLRTAEGVVTNSWAGTVEVEGDGAGTFTVTYKQVPQDVCMGVVSGANGWSKIGTGNSAITVFPATAANAASICSETGSNVMVFTST